MSDVQGRAQKPLAYGAYGYCKDTTEKIGHHRKS